MKHSIMLAIAAIALSANSALADSGSLPEFATPHPPLPQTDDWSGFYAGGMVSFDSASSLRHFDINTNAGSNSPMSDSTSFGGFTGYNFQHGAFVFGGEFAISSGGLTSTFDPTIIYYDAVFDLKARAGYSFGSAMVYGVVGGSFSNLNWGPTLNFPSTSLNYGAGVEYKIGPQMFVGAEYLVRNLSGDRDDSAPLRTRITTQSAQLRVGWRF